MVLCFVKHFVTVVLKGAIEIQFIIINIVSIFNISASLWETAQVFMGHQNYELKKSMVGIVF